MTKIDTYFKKARKLSKEALIPHLTKKELKEFENERKCKWCNDKLKMEDDLLCGACAYKQAFGL